MSSAPAGSLVARDLHIDRGGSLVVQGVTFTAADRQTLGIIGPNGAGKTSLLLALYRALHPHQGGVFLDGDNIAALSRRQVAQQIAVVPQHSAAEMPMTVRDVVALGRLPHTSLAHYGSQDDQAAVDEALRKSGLSQMAGRFVTELSGGEHQRVLIARAIVQDAPFLLLDEPTNHLDLRHQFEVFRLVKSLTCTTVVVLHDLNMAAKVCDSLVLLNDGIPVAQGPTREVLQPSLISDVYGVVAETVSHRGKQHLIFSPPPDNEIREAPQKGMSG